MAKVKRRAEDYLAVIYLLEEQYDQVIAARIADELDVTPATVSQTLGRLRQEKLIARSGTGPVSLTPEGQSRAEALIRRHRLAERWMTDVLGLPWWQAHSEALRLEQAMSPSVEKALDELLGGPLTCPHGNLIPRPYQERQAAEWNLGSLDLHDRFVVERVREPLAANDEYFASLAELDLIPGQRFEVVEKHPLALALRAAGDDNTAPFLVPWGLAHQVGVRIEQRAAHTSGSASELVRQAVG